MLNYATHVVNNLYCNFASVNKKGPGCLNTGIGRIIIYLLLKNVCKYLSIHSLLQL